MEISSWEKFMVAYLTKNSQILWNQNFQYTFPKQVATGPPADTVLTYMTYVTCFNIIFLTNLPFKFGDYVYLSPNPRNRPKLPLTNSLKPHLLFQDALLLRQFLWRTCQAFSLITS
jgi:hypothetical protein